MAKKSVFCIATSLNQAEVIVDLPIVQDMIAGSEYIQPERKQILGDGGRDAKSPC